MTRRPTGLPSPDTATSPLSTVTSPTSTVSGCCGVADPTFTAGTGMTSGQAKRIIQADEPHVAALVQQLKPDVLAVHEAPMADQALGNVPLVIAGHVHERTARRPKEPEY